MKKFKEVIALLFTFIFCVSIIPSSIFAESLELKEEIYQVEENTQTQNNEMESKTEVQTDEELPVAESEADEELMPEGTVALGNPNREIKEEPSKESLAQEYMLRNVIGNRMGNDYLEMAVNQSDGHYTIGTTGGNPNNEQDNYSRMLYGHPSPGTSYTTFAIDEEFFKYGDDGFVLFGKPKFDETSLTNTSTVQYGKIRIKQILSLVENQSTGRKDVVEIKYEVTNRDRIGHNIGARIMLDTMLGNNDSAPFRVPGTGAVTTQTEFVGEDIPAYWQAFDSLENPQVISQGSFLRGENDPDIVQFTSWPSVIDTMWDAPIEYDRPNGDSAVTVCWYQMPLYAGESKTYTTYYGLSELTQDMRPPLGLSIYGDKNATVNEAKNGYNNTTVTAYISNLSEVTAENVKTKINLPEGMILINGDSSEKNVGTIRAGEEKQISWEVNFLSSTIERNLEYSVEVKGRDIEKKAVQSNVNVPPVYISTPTPAPLGKNDALEFTKFLTGKSDKQNNYYRLLAGELARGSKEEFYAKKALPSFVYGSVEERVSEAQYKVDFAQTALETYVNREITDGGPDLRNIADWAKTALSELTDENLPGIERINNTTDYLEYFEVLTHAYFGAVNLSKSKEYSYFSGYLNIRGQFDTPNEEKFRLMLDTNAMSLSIRNDMKIKLERWAEYIYQLDQNNQLEVRKRIRIQCPVEVQFYDLNDNPLLQLKNEEEGAYYTGYGNFYTIPEKESTNFMKAAQLDAKDYKIKMTGTAEGTLDYAIEEVNDTGKVLRKMGYRSIAITDKTIIWAFTNSSKLEVDVDGDDVVDEILELVDFPEKIYLNKEELTIKVGETFNLEVKIEPDSVGQKVNWKSEHPEIATVDENGVVTALSEGKATITVTTEDGNKTAECVVTVTKKDEPKPAEPTTPTVKPGDSGQSGNEGTKTDTTTQTTIKNDGTNPNTSLTTQEKVETMLVMCTVTALCALAIFSIKRRQTK